MKSSEIGGQAVIEGVMMRNKDKYAIAVRKPDKSIIVEVKDYISFSDKHKIFKLPILRGVLAFVESMVVGMKTLTYSAGFFEEEEESQPSKFDEKLEGLFKDKTENVIMGFTIVTAILLAIGLFMILPYFIAGIFEKRITSDLLLAFIEGIIRIVMFLAYVITISQLKDIKRVYMYHGAEHKVINCIERGRELTVYNVKRQSRLHKRCGTSFMLTVMVVSIIFFMMIRVDVLALRIIFRLLLIPVIAGVSYEFIRFAGKNESKFIKTLSIPGLFLQAFTTKEPDKAMIEVAIKSVEAVFDWRDYFAKNGVDLLIEDVPVIKERDKNLKEKDKNSKRMDINVNEIDEN